VNAPDKQLLAYRFPPGATYEGQLVGALERIESGGTLRILDAVFVGRESDSGELVAVSMTGAGSSGMVSRLIGFRLDAHERKNVTRRALEGAFGDALREVGEKLEPGNAVAAILVEHAWIQTLGEAIARTGGTEVGNEHLEANGIDQLLPLLHAAAERPA
jgi:hypothetical protein